MKPPVAGAIRTVYDVAHNPIRGDVAREASGRVLVASGTTGFDCGEPFVSFTAVHDPNTHRHRSHMDDGSGTVIEVVGLRVDGCDLVHWTTMVSLPTTVVLPMQVSDNE